MALLVNTKNSDAVTEKSVLIVTKGNGGDASGAEAIRHKWPSPWPDLINLSDNQAVLSKLEEARYTCIIVIGQAAADELLSRDNIHSVFHGRETGIYTHLIDDRLLNYMKNAPNTTQFFLTSSQLHRLQFKAPQLYYHLLKRKGKGVWTSPLAIKSSINTSGIRAYSTVNFLKPEIVIWLGGNYTSSDGEKIVLDRNVILKSMDNIHQTIETGSSVAIMLIPRLFMDNESRNEKISLLREIKKIFSDNKLRFYSRNSMVDELKTTDIPLYEAPDYADLMSRSWKETKHFVSADQYNLFADLKSDNITPFLFIPNDADQLLYATDFIIGKKQTPVDEQIIRYGCER